MNRFPDYTPSLSETHHVHKLDYPSGTAITLAEELIAAEGRFHHHDHHHDGCACGAQGHPEDT